MATLAQQNVHASNTMVIKVRGLEVGRANAVDINADFGLQPIHEGIGSIMPAEHVSLEWSADISIDTFLIRTRTVQGKPGIADVLGVPINETILLTTPFNLEILDKVTGEPIFVAEDCSWSAHSITIRQGAITGKNARARPLRIRQAAALEPRNTGLV